MLLDRDRITDAIVPSTIAGVDVLPASPALQECARLLAGVRGVENKLRRALDTVQDCYEVILLDCRAGTEIPTLACTIAATSIIGATQAGLKELGNTISLQDCVTDIADGHERPLRLVGILPCPVPASGRAYAEAIDLAPELFGGLLLPPVRRSVAVTEAHAARLPLTARPAGIRSPATTTPLSTNSLPAASSTRAAVGAPSDPILESGADERPHRPRCS